MLPRSSPASCRPPPQWLSRSRRGVALNWVERNAAFVDLKFERLKDAHPGIRCIALVEAPQVDSESLREIVGAVMVHADFVAYSIEEFEANLRRE